MEANQVDATLQSLQQSYYLATIERRVVEAAKTDVLKRTATLVCEVVLFEQCYRLFQRHRLLGRHQLQALFVEWGVHGDGYVTGTLVKEPL